jgi:rhamnose transport system substrate-binding protein
MNLSTLTHISAVLLSLTVFGTTASAEDQPIQKGLKLAFVPKNINNPYNVIETGGSIAACKEMGVEGKVVGPSDPSASSQVSYINTLITQKQSAIVLPPTTRMP